MGAGVVQDEPKLVGEWSNNLVLAPEVMEPSAKAASFHSRFARVRPKPGLTLHVRWLPKLEAHIWGAVGATINIHGTDHSQHWPLADSLKWGVTPSREESAELVARH